MICLCMRDLLGQFMMVLSPISLSVPMFLPCVSHPSFSHEHSFDVPNDISKLCDSNIDLGYDDNNVLNMIGRNV